MFRVAFLSPPSRRRQSTAPFLDDRPMIRLFFVVVVVVVVVEKKTSSSPFFLEIKETPRDLHLWLRFLHFLLFWTKKEEDR